MSICLVTGVPGVGKTTLCVGLARRFPDLYSHISFGRLVLEALRDTGVEADERDLRRRPNQLVTKDILDSATTQLERVVDASSPSMLNLVDSHAVSQTSFGFLATPDGRSYFKRFRYSAILVLVGDSASVLRRSMGEETGRRARTAHDLDVHVSLLNSVALHYSAESECPAYFLEARRSSVETQREAHLLLKGAVK